jgi:hypothetical protein
MNLFESFLDYQRGSSLMKIYIGMEYILAYNFYIKKYKYYFAYGFICVWNLVCHIKREA